MEREKEMRQSKFKRICVFCGSSQGKKSSYQDAAVELGNELVCLGIDSFGFGSSPFFLFCKWGCKVRALWFVDSFSLSWDFLVVGLVFSVIWFSLMGFSYLIFLLFVCFWFFLGFCFSLHGFGLGIGYFKWVFALHGHCFGGDFFFLMMGFLGICLC